MHKFESNSTKETIQLGRKFAESIKIGDNIFLYGDLGSGKTHFVKGICAYFAIEDEITSPTFTIINIYSAFNEFGLFNLQHIDLYRLEKEAELFEIGLEEILDDDNSIKIIEWPQLAENIVTNNIEVRFTTSDSHANKRVIAITMPH